MNIAFIGLGNMGQPMALNLVKAGFAVTVFDLVTAAVECLVNAGAVGADSAVAAASHADVVVTMLPAAMHVKQLYLGDKGMLNSAKPDTLFIDCSTIDAGTARQLAQEAKGKGHAFVDAPVSGGVGGAKAGTLTFIMGGENDDVTRAKAVLGAMGQNLFHAGAAGAGQIAKICNNMLLAVLMAGTSEALKLAIANGLDPNTVSEIMLQSSGSNWTLQKYNPCPGVMPQVPASNDYEGGFMVKLMNKDLNLAMEAAEAVGATTPMAAVAQHLFRMHQQRGFAEKDFSSIFTLF